MSLQRKKTCATCSCWSQLMAIGSPGPMRALCLEPRSPKAATRINSDTWPGLRFSCEFWSDDPTKSDHPEEYKRVMEWGQ